MALSEWLSSIPSSGPVNSCLNSASYCVKPTQAAGNFLILIICCLSYLQYKLLACYPEGLLREENIKYIESVIKWCPTPQPPKKHALQDCCGVEAELLWNGAACRPLCKLLDVPWGQWKGRGGKTGERSFVSSAKGKGRRAGLCSGEIDLLVLPVLACRRREGRCFLRMSQLTACGVKW